jgi:hypothetical protein
MGHPTQSDELLRVAGHELRSVVQEDARRRARESLTGTLQDRLDVDFRHGFTDFPRHDVTAVTIQDGAEIGERTADIEIRDIDVPGFVGPTLDIQVLLLA